MTVRVALVGCGAMGEEMARRVYADGAGPDPGCRVVAVVDAVPERAARVGALLGAPAFGSLEQALGAGVDAVDIRLPHHLHADAAVAALARGAHVLVEKPVATTLPDARRIERAAREAGCVAAVAENYPHLLAVRAARAAIRDGALGRLRAVRTTRAYTLGGVWLRDGWRRGAGPSAGLLLDQGTHHTSLLRRLGGEIVAVSAQASRPRGTPEGDGETVLVGVRFASGLVGQSLYTWGTPALADEAEAAVFGAAGRLEVRVSYDRAAGRAYRYAAAGPLGEAAARPVSPAENYYDSHRLIVEDWVAAIEQGRAPLVGVADGARDLAVVLAAVASVAREGAVVEVPEPG